MCLEVSRAMTKRVLAQLERRGEIVCWKYYKRIGDGELRSPYFSAPAAPGRIVAVNVYRKPSDEYRDREEVNAGIHVFLEELDCRRAAKNELHILIVPVIGKKEHFMAAGTFETRPNAVFTEVFMTQDAYNGVLPPPPPPPYHVGQVMILRASAPFGGGESVVTKVTDATIRFKCRDLTWDCGVDYFKLNLL